MKRLIFVDVENVGSLIDKNKAEVLTSNDKLVLFVNERDKVLRRKIAYELADIRAAIEICTFSATHKNALDFTIVASIGLRAPEADEVIIVSKDMGYQSSIDLFRKNGINIKQVACFQELFVTENQINEERSAIGNALLLAGIKNFTKKQVKICEKMLHSATSKEELHNFIQERFNTVNAAKLYHGLLPLYNTLVGEVSIA